MTYGDGVKTRIVVVDEASSVIERITKQMDKLAVSFAVVSSMSIDDTSIKTATHTVNVLSKSLNELRGVLKDVSSIKVNVKGSVTQSIGKSSKMYKHGGALAVIQPKEEPYRPNWTKYEGKGYGMPNLNQKLLGGYVPPTYKDKFVEGASYTTETIEKQVSLLKKALNAYESGVARLGQDIEDKVVDFAKKLPMKITSKYIVDPILNMVEKLASLPFELVKNGFRLMARAIQETIKWLVSLPRKGNRLFL